MTHAELPVAVLDALAGLPNGDHAPRHRAFLLETDRGFAAALRRLEGALPAPELAELWLWLIHLCIDGTSRTKTTGASYARTVGRYLAWAAHSGYDFRKMTITEFDRWQRWLAIECRNNANFRRQQVHAVRNFYDWRRSRGLAATNIAADLRYPMVKPKPPKKYTDEQLRALFAAVATQRDGYVQRDRCMLLLLLSTGMRREELCTLRLEQLEIGKRTAVVRIDGKGSKQRDVPFEGPAVEALRAWLEYRDALNLPAHTENVLVTLRAAGNSHVTSEPGMPLSLNQMERVLKKLAKEAKLKTWGIHRFRVTFATQLYDDGADIETIRALMGHESIETTRRYLAVSERARRTRLSANRQHAVLGTKPTGAPLWARMAMGDLTSA